MLRTKEQYTRRKEQGVCVECDKSPAEEGVTRCKVCRERHNKRYKRRKEQGVCTQCGGKNPVEEGKAQCKGCIERIRESQRKHYLKYRKRYRERSFKSRNTIEGKFYHDEANAKRRGHYWELTIEQAGLLYIQACLYCGESPNGKLNGIDRRNSSVGYILENCVPCCPTCNFAKRQMSPEEFILHCNKVAQFNKKELKKVK